MHKKSINELSMKAVKVALVGVAFTAAVTLTGCHGAAWKCAPKHAPVVEPPKPAPPPPPPPTPAPPPPPAPMCLKDPLNVYFDFDKSNVKKEYDAKLAELAQCLANNKDQKVEARGHADLRGASDYNVKLSQRRADAVKKSLEGHGVPGASVTALGKGKTEEFGKGKSKDAYQKNRVVLVNVSR